MARPGRRERGDGQQLAAVRASALTTDGVVWPDGTRTSLWRDTKSRAFGLENALDKVRIERDSRSPLMMPIELTEQDRLDLIAFIETLTRAAEKADAANRP